jgi:hypothetical protein
MSKRWAWLAGLVVLLLIAFLIACSNTYNPASNGLVIVTSEGSGLLETFSFSLLAGNNIPILNSPLNTQLLTCQLNGVPTSVVLDPKGDYAYTIINASNCPNAQAGIQVFQVLQNGNLTAVGSLIPDQHAVALSMDPAGKFLFVLEGINQANANNPVPQVAQCYQSTESGACSYAIGSGGSLTPVPGTYNFVLPPGFQAQYYFSALSPTSTVRPPLQNGVQTSYCSNPGYNPPTTQYLYVADSTNGVVWEFGVDTSTGALTNPPNQTSVPYFPNSLQTVPNVLQAPSGVVVEPCDRFVYVTNLLSNTVAGFSICNGLATESTNCAAKLDGSLWPVTGSPFSVTGAANGPGPVVSDPFGNNIYVLNTLSNTISPFHVGTISGTLTPGTAVGTGGLQAIAQQGQLFATSIAIRGDDNWLFVTNFNSASLAEFSIIPSTGALQSFPTIVTDDYPYGVAVK